MENIPPQVFPVGSSAMIMKFNSDGERLWGTYFGGLYSKDITNIESIEGGILFSYGNQFVEDQIFGENPFQSELMGSFDVFITKFSDQGEMIWSTAFGGNGNDNDDALAIRGNKFAVCGRTSSSEFYQTEQSWQDELNGTGDLYLALFQDNVLSTTSVEKDSPSLTLYPNPSISGRLTLDWDIQGLEQVDLVIFDQLGREVDAVGVYAKNSDLVLPNLRAGIYFLTFEFEDVLYSKKLIIAQ